MFLKIVMEIEEAVNLGLIKRACRVLEFITLSSHRLQNLRTVFAAQEFRTRPFTDPYINSYTSSILAHSAHFAVRAAIEQRTLVRTRSAGEKYSMPKVDMSHGEFPSQASSV
jgi:hypothetical protein